MELLIIKVRVELAKFLIAVTERINENVNFSQGKIVNNFLILADFKSKFFAESNIAEHQLRKNLDNNRFLKVADSTSD